MHLLTRSILTLLLLLMPAVAMANFHGPQEGSVLRNAALRMARTSPIAYQYAKDQSAVQERAKAALDAGVAEARARGAKLKEQDLQLKMYFDFKGEPHPTLKRLAIREDGTWKGKGPEMKVLLGNLSKSRAIHVVAVEEYEKVALAMILGGIAAVLLVAGSLGYVWRARQRDVMV